MSDDRKQVSRREFIQSAAMAAGALGVAEGVQGASPQADIKIGLYSITYGGVWYSGGAQTVEEVLQRAKKFGYQGVEIDGKRPHGNPLDMPKARCQRLRKMAADMGLEIYAVSGNNDFSSPIPEHREAQMVYLRELMRMTQELGAKTIRVFLAWPGVTLLPEGGGRYDISKAVWVAAHKDFTDEQTWAWCREGMAEASRLAGDFGVVLALQNHPPVIAGYKDVLKMVKEVGSPNLKVCFDARLEHSLDEAGVRRALNEVGSLQVLWHYGGEFDKGPDGRIVLKGDEKALGEALGLLDIGYRGYAGFELCHPLPVVNGKTVGVDFVDKNAQLAREYMQGIIAEAKKQHAAKS